MSGWQYFHLTLNYCQVITLAAVDQRIILRMRRLNNIRGNWRIHLQTSISFGFPLWAALIYSLNKFLEESGQQFDSKPPRGIWRPRATRGNSITANQLLRRSNFNFLAFSPSAHLFDRRDALTASPTNETRGPKWAKVPSNGSPGCLFRLICAFNQGTRKGRKRPTRDWH